MANTVERHTSRGSQRRTERGSGDKDAHRNPNFSIDRSNPASAHPYESRHPKPTIIQQFLGTGPGAKDIGAIRRTYNKKTFMPGMRDLKRGFRRPATMLKQELRDVRRNEGFDQALPHLVENSDLRDRLNRRKKSIYQDVRRLERQSEREDDPGRSAEIAKKLERAHDRANQEYENLVEHELRDLKLDYHLTKKELVTDREATMRSAREEIYGGQDTPGTGEGEDR